MDLKKQLGLKDCYMTSNSVTTLSDKIAEKTRLIESMEASSQEKLLRALKGLDDALTQSISDLQPKLINGLRQQLQVAHDTTLTTIANETKTQALIIQQRTQSLQQQNQDMKRNLTFMGWWYLTIMGFSVVLLMILLTIVWLRTPTDLMGEPSQVANGWIVLTSPSWTVCQFRQGNPSPCRPIQK